MHKYYHLVASLPPLSHFERATQLPITEKQLRSRLNGLLPPHKQELFTAEALLAWPRQPQLTGQLGKASTSAPAFTETALQRIVDHRQGLRSVVAALRYQHQGQACPSDTSWGYGRWVRILEAHWDEASLGVAPLYPWVAEAKALIASSDAMALERLLMREAWSFLSRIEDQSPFGFERVASYFFKWDIARRYLSYDDTAASERFHQLVEEIIS